MVKLTLAKVMLITSILGFGLWIINSMSEPSYINGFFTGMTFLLIFYWAREITRG